MNNQAPETGQQFSRPPLPPQQAYLLLAILLGYPLVSITMNMLRPFGQTEIESRIEQIYLPALFIQILMLSLVYAVLKRTGAGLKDIGLSRTDINWSNALSGLIFFVGAWGVILLVRGAIAKSGYLPEKDFLYVLPQTIAERSVWLMLSIGAAMSEEIVFRGYVISRVKAISGYFLLGAVLSSLAFSLGHLYQGLAGVAMTFVYGLLFAGLYAARGSIFPCIVAHFLQDALVLAAFPLANLR